MASKNILPKKIDDDESEQITLKEENANLINVCSIKLNKDPTSKKARLLRASVYMKMGDYESAKKDLFEIENESSLKCIIYFLLGNIEKELNNLEASEEFLTKSIKADPNNVNAYFLRATVLNLEGKFQEAISDYYIALEKDSKPDIKKNIFKNLVQSLDIQERNDLITDLNPKVNDISEVTETKTNFVSENFSNLFPSDTSKYKNSSIAFSNIDIDNEINKNLNIFLTKSYRNLPEPKTYNKLSHESLNFKKKIQSSKDLDKYLSGSNSQYINSNYKRKNKISNFNKFASNPFSEIDNSKEDENFDGMVLETDNSKTGQEDKGSNGGTEKNINCSILDDSEEVFINDRISEIKSPLKSNKRKEKHLRTNGSNLTIQRNLEEWEKHFEEGQFQRKFGNFASAVDEYTKSIKLKPNCFKTYFYRAFSFDKMNLFEEAINDYTFAIQLNSTSPFSFYNRGIVYDKLNDYKNSIEDFSKAISLNPKVKEFYFNRGLSYKKNKQYDLAIADLDHFLSQQKSISFTPFFNRAYCYEKIGKIEDAIDDLNKCLNINSNNYKVIYKIASLHYKLGQFEDAKTYYTFTIKVNPRYSKAYEELGIINSKEKNFEGALNNFTKAIEVEDNNSIYYFNRACVYQSINETDKALEDLNKAIEINPNKNDFYINRAFISMNKNNFEMALKDYNVLLSRIPNHFSTLINRAVCFTKMGRAEEAIADYTSIINKDEKNTKCLMERALLYEALGKIELSIADLTKVVTIEPVNANAYMKRGTLYEQIGSNELALKDYEKAILADHILEEH
ncbi:MAG: tetratricopeptide repeat protein [archaeon]|nr:tetratricopeptide repeat protein [archaeon]